MTTRADFLAGSTTAAAIVAAGASPAPAPLYDFATVAARLAAPARHRQVFAVARVAEGTVAGGMRHSLDAYEVARGEGPGTLHAVAVFYGRGVILGLDDRAWDRYRLDLNARRRGESLGAPAENGNPFAADLATLARRGCTFLVCDNALADWAAFLAASGSYDGSASEVHAGLRASLIPSAFLVPAGVAALNDAQEARFTYVQASL